MSVPDVTSNLPLRQYAAPVGQHVSLGGALRFILFLVLEGLAVAAIALAGLRNEAFILAVVVSVIVLWTLVSGIRVAAEWERGVVLRLGSLHGVRGPGVIYIVPLIDYVRFVDTRTLVLNIPSQRAITRDNVPAQIDGALFFLITDAQRAVTKVQDYQFAIAQYAQASLRDVVGGMTLDELLSEREQIQRHIQSSLEARVTEWGLHVDSVRLLDIELPEDLKRMMSRQASAEREKRANITKAEGDKEAAVNLSAAAQTMMASPGAMQLRSLQTIDGLGPSASNTVVLFPVEWVEMLKTFTSRQERKPEE